MKLIALAVLLLCLVGCNPSEPDCPKWRIVQNHDGTYSPQWGFLTYKDDSSVKPFKTIEQARAYVNVQKANCIDKNKRRAVE